MSQEKITEILRKNYPSWMTARDILEKSNLNERSVYRALQRLRSRDEVDLLYEWSSRKHSSWEWKYRERKK